MERRTDMDYYVKLTTDEWNVLQKLIFKSHLEEVVSLDTDVNNGDYFYDFDCQQMLTFTERLEDIIVADIGSKGYYYATMSKEERQTIKDIFDKYCSNVNTKKYVEKVNKTLDND